MLRFRLAVLLGLWLLPSLAHADSGTTVTRHVVAAASGDVLRLQVMQRGADVVLRLRGPGGELLVEVDRWTRDVGPELILWPVQDAGDYGLEIVHGQVVDESLEDSPTQTAMGWDPPTVDVRQGTAVSRQGALAYLDFVAAAADSGATGLPDIAARLARLGEPALAWEARYEDVYRRGRRTSWQEVAAEFAVLADDARALGEKFWELLARDNLVQAQLDGGMARQALETSRRGLELCDALQEGGWPMRYWRALSHVRRQRIFSFLGRLEESLQAGDMALDLLQSPAEDRWRVDVLHHRGVLLRRNFGDAEGAIESLRQALAVMPEDGAFWRGYRANTLDQLGAAYEMQDAFGAAREAYEHAVAAGGTPCAVANHRARLALLLARQSRWLEEEERATARRLGRAVASSSLRRARQLAVQAEQQRSQSLAELARRVQEEAPCGRDGQAVRQRLAELARLRGRTGEAEFLLQERLRIATRMEDRLAALESHLDLARLAMDADLWRRPATSGTSSKGTVERHLQRADALYETLRRQTARESLRLGLANGARERTDLRIAWWAARGVGEGAASLEGPYAKAFVLAEDSKGRLFRDALMRRGSSPDGDGSAASQGPSWTVADLARRLGPASHLISLRLGRGSSHLWWLSRGRLHYRPLPPRADLERWARRLRRALRDPSSDVTAQWMHLSAVILGPLAGDLRALAAEGSEQRLTVVADGIFETLPWAALSLGESAYRPLLEDFQVARLPSAAVWLEESAPPSAAPPPPEGHLLVVADPQYVDVPLLAGSAAEGEAIRRLAAARGWDVTLFRGREATKGRLLDGALEQADLLHFAVHGAPSSRRPGEVALLLSQVDVDDHPVAGELHGHELRGLDLRARLVVLSACESGLGNLEPGEGMVNALPAGFLQAGARQVVAGLWQVSDEVTARLMSRLYEELLYPPPTGRSAKAAAADDARRRPSPLEALRRAQLAIRRTPTTEHPFYWAAFVMHGLPMQGLHGDGVVSASRPPVR